MAEALQATGVTARVLVCDEAHRTAGLRRKGGADDYQRCDFTICHDNDAFPATYRVYQTATSRIYDIQPIKNDDPTNWVVRSMDDTKVFGVDLYRKSYVEAVNQGWLADYRIIALGVNDHESYALVHQLAQDTRSTGRRKLSAADYLRGLAFTLAIGGAAQSRDDDSVPIQSCIAFMNTIDKSKNMAIDLESESVRKWLQNWLHDNKQGKQAAHYRLQHLDASSSVAVRDNAKDNLAKGTPEEPNGIINVGIFGEGTDSPSLSAVAFLEARKSPIDVIQAVGRAMRTSPGKQHGYIICPILIPPNEDAEDWLATSGPEDGWRELGQILRALRAHDARIVEELGHLLKIYVPPPPEEVRTIVAIADSDKKRIEYRQHTGAPGDVEFAVERVIKGESTLSQEFQPISPPPDPAVVDRQASSLATEPTQIVTRKRYDDDRIEIRRGSVERAKPKADGTRGKVNLVNTKKQAKLMINSGFPRTRGDRPRVVAPR